MHALLAAVSGQDILQAVIWIIVVGVIFWLLTYLVGAIPLPEPFNKVMRVILLVAAVLFLINILLGFTGHPLVSWR